MIVLNCRTLKVVLDPIQGAFALPLCSRLAHNVDVILFNPPYVPTEFEEIESLRAVGLVPDSESPSVGVDEAGISSSWAGGSDGMQITNLFLDQVEVSEASLRA